VCPLTETRARTQQLSIYLNLSIPRAPSVDKNSGVH